ncbi:MAG TPA: hypothetical protein VFI46_01110 [Jiangellaceae bacterium]|nr:hypothetical protein [Jiangellaceae bacterium]
MKSKSSDIALPILSSSRGEIFGPRRDPLVELVHRRIRHELGGGRAHLALLRAHLRINPVRPDVRRHHDQSVDLGWVLRRCVQRHPTAERVTHQVRLVEPEVGGERRDVIGHQPHVNRSIDVCGAAVPLQVDGDDLVALRQCRNDRPEHFTRPKPAVQ